MNFRQGSRSGARQTSSVDQALSVDTVVIAEKGRWAVDIIVVFADGVVRKRIHTHPTQRRAEIAADLIRRAADRDPRLAGPGWCRF